MCIYISILHTNLGISKCIMAFKEKDGTKSLNVNDSENNSELWITHHAPYLSSGFNLFLFPLVEAIQPSSSWLPATCFNGPSPPPVCHQQWDITAPGMGADTLPARDWNVPDSTLSTPQTLAGLHMHTADNASPLVLMVILFWCQ